MLRWILMLVLLSPAVLQADVRARPLEWAQPMLGIELDNFYRLDDQVYRSKQPDDEEMVALEAMGVHSVLNLREFHSDEDDAEGTRLKLYHVPVNAGEIDDRFIVAALRAIAEAKKPILIHCWHGSDRTGVVAAMYRMVFQNWPRQQAIDEFVNGGYGYHASFYPNIERYLATVDIAAIKRQVLVQHSVDIDGLR
ncbi:MAG: tyrosine-protein phosphatase [Candidatus Thiodiazotropha sp.]|jgi:tyrosine-protein phosphatase SIW14